MFGFGSPRKRKKMSSRQLWFSVFFFFFNVMSWWFVFSIAIAIPASFEGVGDLVCFVFVLISVGFVLFYLHLGCRHGSQRTTCKNLVLPFSHVDPRDGTFDLLSCLPGPGFCSF